MASSGCKLILCRLVAKLVISTSVSRQSADYDCPCSISNAMSSCIAAAYCMAGRIQMYKLAK